MANNILPFRSSLGSNPQPMRMRPTQKFTRPSRSSKDFFNKLNVDQILKGHKMREGSYKLGFLDEILGATGTNRFGFKGQLSNLRWQGRRGQMKNVSERNLEQIHDILSPYLKKRPAYSKKAFTIKDRKKILSESWKLMKTPGSNFTRYDRDDLISIMKSLEKKYNEQYRTKYIERDINPNAETNPHQAKTQLNSKNGTLAIDNPESQTTPTNTQDSNNITNPSGL